ncbi:hypothetical protein PIB30_069802 [Stylosanthes scabra]|uniref:Secreted protein n=1 Tax=Stylosanthes scabra TaxID=79078 RepID=A0ABU6YM65_9FABA|nr:hypothetical protein [Stylosanthes scabra]
MSVLLLFQCFEFLRSFFPFSPSVPPVFHLWQRHCQRRRSSVFHFSFLATMFHFSITALVSSQYSSCLLPTTSVRPRPLPRLANSLGARPIVSLLRSKVLPVIVRFV